MIALLAAERVKLVSTRSPWWCGGLAIALVVGLTALAGATARAGADVTGVAALFLSFGLLITMVAATLAATTEYRFGTMRATFLAVPNRTAALLAKTVVVAGLSGLVGLLASVAGWVVLRVLAPAPGPRLGTADDWRALLAPAVTYAVAAMIALAVGVLVRHTAAAVTIVLAWSVAEAPLTLIPVVGPKLLGWLPFANLGNVLHGDPGMLFSPWGSFVYVLALAVGLLWAAMLVTQSRDA